MKAKTKWLVALLVVLCLAGWTGFGQKQPQHKPGWEYLVTASTDSVDINDLGAKGWELVAVTGFENGTKYYFKRPK